MASSKSKSVTARDSTLVARHWFDRFVTHIGINPAIGIKLRVAGASQVRRFFHDPRRKACSEPFFTRKRFMAMNMDWSPVSTGPASTWE
jgi:hypothetical protein